MIIIIIIIIIVIIIIIITIRDLNFSCRFISRLMDQHPIRLIRISALTITIIIIIINMARTFSKTRFFCHLVLYSSSFTKTVKNQ